MLLLWSFGINNEYTLTCDFFRWPNRIVYFVPWKFSIQDFGFFFFFFMENNFQWRKRNTLVFFIQFHFFFGNFGLKCARTQRDKEKIIIQRKTKSERTLVRSLANCQVWTLLKIDTHFAVILNHCVNYNCLDYEILRLQRFPSAQPIRIDRFDFDLVACSGTEKPLHHIHAFVQTSICTYFVSKTIRKTIMSTINKKKKKKKKGNWFEMIWCSVSFRFPRKRVWVNAFPCFVSYKIKLCMFETLQPLLVHILGAYFRDLHDVKSECQMRDSYK